MCMLEELSGGGSVAVAVGVGNKGHVTCDMLHVTHDSEHLTTDKCQGLFCCWYPCSYPHILRDSVFPLRGIF